MIPNAPISIQNTNISQFYIAKLYNHIWIARIWLRSNAKYLKKNVCQEENARECIQRPLNACWDEGLSMIFYHSKNGCIHNSNPNQPQLCEYNATIASSIAISHAYLLKTKQNLTRNHSWNTP